MRLTFVVGTGRCGSTMLSRLLSLHPDVLSVSEFFCTMPPGSASLPTGDIDGRRLWRLLSSPEPSLDGIVRDGLAGPELCYPYGRGRFDVATGVPRISHMTLPTLSDDPDALFDKLAAEVPAWPVRPAARQLVALFEYLAQLLGRGVIVERTAGSLLFVPQLRRMFDDARFVHFYRNGPDCALSMSTHAGVRPMALMEQAGLLRHGRQGRAAWAAAPPDLVELLAPPMVMRQVMNYPAPPLPVFGRLWSRMVISGLATLAGLPAGTCAFMSYEDVLRDPGRELTRLARFAGAEPRPDWLAASARWVDGGRSGRASQLGRADLDALRAACEPGMAALTAASHQTPQ